MPLTHALTFTTTIASPTSFERFYVTWLSRARREMSSGKFLQALGRGN